jgi:4-hydroxy-3-methylbut-2-enyl diphosphate reductase
VVVVVGSPSSSNSNRLRELAEKLGTPAYMVDSANDLEPAWFEGRQRVGLTAGASAPEFLVQQVIERLRSLGVTAVRRMQGVEEKVQFPLPLGLGDRSMAGHLQQAGPEPGSAAPVATSPPASASPAEVASSAGFPF